MSLSESTPIAKSARTAARVIEGRAVVIVIDRQELHTLDAVGTRIWELADGRTLGDIVDVLVREYEVTRETALADARAFLSDLDRLGALTSTEAPA